MRTAVCPTTIAEKIQYATWQGDWTVRIILMTVMKAVLLTVMENFIGSSNFRTVIRSYR
jgi:hypothetical protein